MPAPVHPEDQPREVLNNLSMKEERKESGEIEENNKPHNGEFKHLQKIKLYHELSTHDIFKNA